MLFGENSLPSAVYVRGVDLSLAANQDKFVVLVIETLRVTGGRLVNLTNVYGVNGT